MNRSVRLRLELECSPEAPSSGPRGDVSSTIKLWEKTLVMHDTGVESGPHTLTATQTGVELNLRELDPNRMHLFIVFMDYDDATDRRFIIQALDAKTSVSLTSTDVEPALTIDARETIERDDGNPEMLFHSANVPLFQMMGAFVSSTRVGQEDGKIVVRKLGGGANADVYIAAYEFMEEPDEVVELWPD